VHEAVTTLGGTLWVRNAIELDYCVGPAIRSLAGVCDKVLVGDAQSTDGTLDLLTKLADELPNVEVLGNLPWGCADNYLRISRLANMVREELDTDWHFMLQADEVIHEQSYPWIRSAIELHGAPSAFTVSRFNLFGGFDRMIRMSLPNERKPCSDRVIRLAKTSIPSFSDGESLQPAAGDCADRTGHIVIFHYGFVRDVDKLIHKTRSMQQWFHGPGSGYDTRIDKAKVQGRFDYKLWFQDHELDKPRWPHPKVAQRWVADREGQWKQ